MIMSKVRAKNKYLHIIQNSNISAILHITLEYELIIVAHVRLFFWRFFQNKYKQKLIIYVKPITQVLFNNTLCSYNGGLCYY